MMKSRTLAVFVTVICLLLAPLTPAGDFFVSKSGNDSNDGLSLQTSFLTVQKGLDALAAGDTLTIAPGEYFETVKRDDLGNLDIDTVIRAAIPGTVLLRGDIVAPEFSPLEGKRFVYWADVEEKVEAVAETDTLTILFPYPHLAVLEQNPGSCHYDADAKRIYISTSDMQTPDNHIYRLLVTPDSGMRLANPKRVVLDGLAATGFFKYGITGLNFAFDNTWGFVLTNPENCRVLNCIAFLNNGGITLSRGSGNLIDNCTVYANSSPYSSVGGIILYRGNNDVISNCRAFRSTNSGLLFYLGINEPEKNLKGPLVLRDSLSWGNANNDFLLKTGESARFGYAERCISGGAFNVGNTTNCLQGGYNSYRRDIGSAAGNIQMPAAKNIRNSHYADPDNFDFRLQSTSQLRGQGPDGSDPGPYQYQNNIFYVAPDGDDTSAGTALDLAWRSLERAAEDLKEGDTLYLLPGEHHGSATLELTGVNIRGRGITPAVITGNITLSKCANLTMERLSFPSACTIEDSSDIKLGNCLFDDFDAANTANLKIEHCVYAGRPAFRSCRNLFLSGNIFSDGALTDPSEILYSDYNSYHNAETAKLMPDRYAQIIQPHVTKEDGRVTLHNAQNFAGKGPNGTSIGPFRIFKAESLKLSGPWVHSISDSTADIEWMTTQPAVCEIAWGETEECLNSEKLLIRSSGTFSLTGLNPGTTYHFKIKSIRASKKISVDSIPPLIPEDAAMTFTTATTPGTPATRYVATDGDDSNDGLTRQTAWRNISTAGERIKAGDTVLVAGGIYMETVYVRSTGDAQSPITFMAMPGEKVVFDAGRRELSHAFIVSGKKFINFDGFYFTGFNDGDAGGIFVISGSSDLRISRCLMNGLGGGYNPEFLYADSSPRITIENSVICSGFTGMKIFGCPDFTMKNSIFLRNMIQALVAGNAAEDKVYLSNNIISDSLPSKVSAQLFEMPLRDALVEKDNCFHLRISPEERHLFLFYRQTELGDTPLSRRMTLARYWSVTGNEGNSIAADPVFAAVQGDETSDKNGKPVFMADRLLGKRGLKLDFPDLFATNPELVERGIGLQPAAFADFWFNQEEEAATD